MTVIKSGFLYKYEILWIKNAAKIESFVHCQSYLVANLSLILQLLALIILTSTL